MLNLEDKALYHQIHPLKLAADWGSTPLALYWLWRHKLWAGLGVSLIPPVVASWAIMRFVNLEPYRQSAFGHYIRHYMTPPIQGLRLAGFGLLGFGAWVHRAWLIPAGLDVILLAWLRGIIFPDSPLRK